MVREEGRRGKKEEEDKKGKWKRRKGRKRTEVRIRGRK